MTSYSWMPGRCAVCGLVTCRARRGTIRGHYAIVDGVLKRCPGSFKEPGETFASWADTPGGDEGMAGKLGEVKT